METSEGGSAPPCGSKFPKTLARLRPSLFSVWLAPLRFTHPTLFRSTPAGSEYRACSTSGFAPLIPRGTVVPFKACFDSSRVVAANKLHFLLRARCALIWFRLPPLRWLSSAGLALSLPSLCGLLRWLRPRRPCRLLKSPYLTPWSERSWRLQQGAPPPRVAQFS